MADPLSQLRDYATQNRLPEIRQQDGLIIFGDYGWPVETKTTYTIWNSGKEGGPRDYYTLETLLFFLQNSGLPHPQYTREAVTRNVHVVRLPDRKDLLAYLRGEISSCGSIDRSAPLEITLQRPVAVKRLQEEQAAAAEAAAEAEKKRARLTEEAQEQEAPPESTAVEQDDQAKGQASPDISKSAVELMPGAVPEGISADKLAEIIRKRKQKKQTGTIPPSVNIPPSSAVLSSSQFYPPVPTISAASQDTAAAVADPSGIVDSIERFPASTADLDLERDVYSRERRCRTRLTLLKAQNSQFSDNVFNTLQAIKANAEGHRAPQPTAVQVQPTTVSRPHVSGYSRYDQEIFLPHGNEASDFDIDVSKYSSLIRNNPTINQQKPSSRHSVPGSMGNPAVSPASGASPASGDGSSRKKTSRTPIIVIPAAESAVITMYNVKELLQDMKFVATADKKAHGMKRDAEVLIQRQKEGGLTVPYRVIDSVARLSPADWDRVVAVFVQGPAWQFKGWPWNGNPTEIFAHVKAFHLKWTEMPLDSNVQNWSVKIISLDRYKRHLDRASLQQFWDMLDVFMSKQKPHLRF